MKIGGSCCARFANFLSVVLVLSVLRLTETFKSLKIKIKAFSLCFNSAKYNSTVNIPYVHHITEFI